MSTENCIIKYGMHTDFFPTYYDYLNLNYLLLNHLMGCTSKLQNSAITVYVWLNQNERILKTYEVPCYLNILIHN